MILPESIDGDANISNTFDQLICNLGVEAPESPESRTIGAKFTGVSTFLAVALSVCYLL